MVTSKDFVEANAYGRRRVVNAFLFGCSNQTVAPTVVRTICWSVVLALVLLLVAAAIAYLAAADADVQAQVTGPGRWRGRVGGCT